MISSIQRERLAKRIATMIARRRSGHLCSSLSVLDILRAIFLYDDGGLDVARANVVLSKGHAAPALYAVLEERGDLPPDAARELRRVGSPFEGHPRRGAVPTVEVSTGSLGNGLAWAVGHAIGQRFISDVQRRPTICIVSDGELQTGIVRESLATACHYGAERLTVIVDNNGWQTDGTTLQVHGLESRQLLGGLPLWQTEVDGHAPAEIIDALKLAMHHSPAVVIANTVRCHGLEWISTGPEAYGESLSEETRARLLAWAAE